MQSLEDKRFKSIFPMLREYFLDYLEVNDVTVNAMMGKMKISGGTVLPTIVHGGTPSIQTIELVMEYFNLSYTDLEDWYEKRHEA